MRYLLLITTGILFVGGLTWAQDPDLFQISVGGGVVGDQWKCTQNMVAPDYPSIVRIDGAGSSGLQIFVDITRFFSLTAGARVISSPVHGTLEFSGTTETWDDSGSIGQFTLGAELKYPLFLSKGFSMAPVVGLEYFSMANGQLNGTALNSDQTILFSPLYLTGGIEINAFLDNHIFLRFPVCGGIALNSRLSDAYYQDYGAASYFSSFNWLLEAGVEVGYLF